MKCCTGPQTWLRVYKNWVTRKTFGPKKEETTEISEKCTMRSFMICTLHQIFGWSEQIGWQGQSKKMKELWSFKMFIYTQWDSVTFFPEHWKLHTRCISTRNLCTERIQQCSTLLTCGWSQNTLLFTNSVTSSLNFRAVSRWLWISNFVTIPSTARRTAWLSTDRKWWCHRLESANLSHKSKFSSPS